MSLTTKIRVNQLSGSFGNALGLINDGGANPHQENKSPLADIGGKIIDLSGSLSYIATSIRRIHGGADFSNQAAGLFSESIIIADNKKIEFGNALGGDATIEFDADGTEELRIAGAALTVEQAATFDGDVTLGNVGGDTITVLGNSTFAGTTIANLGTVSAATSITSTDIIGTVITANTAVVPDSSGGADLGSTALEWGDIFIADNKAVKFGSDQDASIEYDADGTSELRIAGAALTVEQAATFDGAVTLGNAGADTITVLGNSTFAGTTIANLGTVSGATSITSTNFVGALDGAIGGVTPSTVVGTTITANTAVVPDASGGADLGTTALEWGDIFIADNKAVKFGSDQDASIEYDADGTSELRIAGAALTVEQAATFDGAVTLGNAGEDTITVLGNSTFAGTTIANLGTVSAATSITATDIIGTTITANTNIVPDASGGADLGTAALEWGDVFIADDKVIKLGSDQDFLIEFDANGSQMGSISSVVGGGTMVTGGNLGLHLSGASGPLYMSSSHVITFAASGMVSGFDGQGMALADDADWNSFVTNFTNSTSLIGAINTLKTSDSVEPTLFASSSWAPVAANAAVTVVKVAGNSGITNLLAHKPSNVLVYVNGQLLAKSGSGGGNVAAGFDYVVQGNGSANQLKFSFALEQGDQISVYEMS